MSSGRGHAVNFFYLHDCDQVLPAAKSIIHLSLGRTTDDEEGDATDGRGLAMQMLQRVASSCVSSEEREKKAEGRKEERKGA